METSEKDNLIIKFLKIFNININNFDELNGLIIQRDDLIHIYGNINNKYQQIKLLIPELKKYFSSTKLNSLHKNASDNQKWPVLNILRQILKTKNFILIPKRIANGYTKSGQKLYRRIFTISKI